MRNAYWSIQLKLMAVSPGRLLPAGSESAVGVSAVTGFSVYTVYKYRSVHASLGRSHLGRKLTVCSTDEEHNTHISHTSLSEIINTTTTGHIKAKHVCFFPLTMAPPPSSMDGALRCFIFEVG